MISISKRLGTKCPLRAGRSLRDLCTGLGWAVGREVVGLPLVGSSYASLLLVIRRSCRRCWRCWLI
jgi:hypothetical protein